MLFPVKKVSVLVPQASYQEGFPAVVQFRLSSPYCRVYRGLGLCSVPVLVNRPIWGSVIIDAVCNGVGSIEPLTAQRTANDVCED